MRRLPIMLLFMVSGCADLPINSSSGSVTGVPAGVPGEEAEPEQQSGSGAAVQELVASSRASRSSGDYVHARADIERALRIAPRNPYLWLELGEIQLSQNDARRAATTARKALSVAGQDSAARAAADDLLERASRQ